MKFAIHNINITNISSGDESAVEEIIYPYKGQALALRDIAAAKVRNCTPILDISIEEFEKNEQQLIKDLKELKEVDSAVKFRLPFPAKNILKQIEGCFIHFSYAVGTVQELMTQVQLGAKEVYVTGSLAADKDTLKFLKEKIRIRIIPNVIQTNAFIFGNPGEIDPYKCFWIRPEGVKFYEDCVDVMEFAFVEGEEDRESAMLHFYNIGSYRSKLGLIISDSTGSLENVYSQYYELIDEYKSKCQLRCQSGSGCNVCSRIPVQAEMLQQAEEKILNSEKTAKND